MTGDWDLIVRERERQLMRIETGVFCLVFLFFVFFYPVWKVKGGGDCRGLTWTGVGVHLHLRRSRPPLLSRPKERPVLVTYLPTNLPPVGGPSRFHPWDKFPSVTSVENNRIMNTLRRDGVYRRRRDGRDPRTGVGTGLYSRGRLEQK